MTPAAKIGYAIGAAGVAVMIAIFAFTPSPRMKQEPMTPERAAVVQETIERHKRCEAQEKLRDLVRGPNYQPSVEQSGADLQADLNCKYPDAFKR